MLKDYLEKAASFLLISAKSFSAICFTDMREIAAGNLEPTYP